MWLRYPMINSAESVFQDVCTQHAVDTPIVPTAASSVGAISNALLPVSFERETPPHILVIEKKKKKKTFPSRSSATGEGRKRTGNGPYHLMHSIEAIFPPPELSSRPARDLCPKRDIASMLTFSPRSLREHMRVVVCASTALPPTNTAFHSPPVTTTVATEATTTAAAQLFTSAASLSLSLSPSV